MYDLEVIDHGWLIEDLRFFRPKSYAHSNDQINLITPYSARLIYLNCSPLEVVSRYRDPQLQVAENYTYFFLIEHKY